MLNLEGNQLIVGNNIELHNIIDTFSRIWNSSFLMKWKKSWKKTSLGNNQN